MQKLPIIFLANHALLNYAPNNCLWSFNGENFDLYSLPFTPTNDNVYDEEAVNSHVNMFILECFIKVFNLTLKIIKKLYPRLILDTYSVRFAYLKVVSVTFLLVCFVCLKESALETRKNVFYVTSKALFVREKIEF